MSPPSPIPASTWSLTPQWAFSPWLVALLVLIAGGLVVHLYRAQQSAASRRVIVTLTTLRLLLVALMFVLLAGLSVRWRHTSSAGGTLWVLVDNSASMAHADPRATPTEKLRAADALGLLPPDFRPSKLDRHIASLEALRADASHLRSRAELPPDEANAARDADARRAWGDRLRATADAIAKDAEGGKADATLLATLRDAAGKSADAPDTAQWPQAQKAIDGALAALRPLADAADQKLLSEKSADPRLADALDKASKLTRAQFALHALTEKPQAGGNRTLPNLLKRKQTKVITFSGAPAPLAASGPADLPAAIKSAAASPAGQSTNLAAALRHVHDHLAQDEPASVVVVSDGRHNHGGDLVEPARLLASRGARVFTLALGSSQVAADATVEQLDAPDWVYHDDTLRASALLRLDGLAGKPVNVEFHRAGKKIDAKTVTPTQDRTTQVVHFTDKPPDAGVFEYEVRVAELPDEAVKENNRISTRVAVKKDKLAVLVVEDMPRWEYRHLVAYLSRDQRVKLQTVLLQPARVENVTPPASVRASPKNEGVEAQLLPAAATDWAAFDLVVLGDVPKEALTEQDQRHLATAVRDRGTALLLIAGQFNMPQRFAGTPLEALVPVELNAEWPPEVLADRSKKGFRPTLAPEGATSILGQFTLDEQANGALWSALPPWYWHSALTQARRSANVVWTIDDAASPPTTQAVQDDRADARDRALLCTQSVGMGRVMYLASDSTWRMRQVQGQNPHERFWGQVIRWVVDNELPAGGKLVRFGADKPRYVAGEPVVVTARLLGEDLAPLPGQKLRAVARAGEKIVAQSDLAELPDAPGYYRATLGDVPAGRVELSLQGDAAEKLLAADPATAQKTLSIDVQSQLSVEQQNVNADRAAMQRIAEAGGGASLAAPYADVLAAQIPDLDYATERTEQAGLFAPPGERYARLSHWAFLAIFVALASAEWIVRKSAGLV